MRRLPLLASLLLMWRLLQKLWAALNSDAPKDTSGCSRGGLCRHQENCPRLNCAGHPQHNIGRYDDEIHPPGWGHPIVLLVVVWTIVLGAGIVALVRWLVG